NNAVRLANNEHLQSKDEKDWNTILTSWQDYASTLKEMYSRNHNQQNKQAKHVTKVVLDLFERLTNATRKIFLYLNQKQEFIVFAGDAYNIGYEQRKWLYAAELAYEIGCVCHELGKHEESRQWIELLTTCLIKVENFDGAWENVY